MDVHLLSLLSEFPLFLRQRKEHRIQQDILPGLPLHAGYIEINKRIIQEKQGKEKPEREADRDVR